MIFFICTTYPILFGWPNKKLRWPGHVVLWEREEVYTEFWWGNLGERDLLEDLGVDGPLILKWPFMKCYRGKGWSYVAQDREWWRAPLNAGNFFNCWGSPSFSRRTLLHIVSLTRHSRKRFSYIILSSFRLPRSDINDIAQTAHVVVVSCYARLVVWSSFQAVEITPEKEVSKPDSIFRCLPLFWTIDALP
jgi:hypothetical protein